MNAILSTHALGRTFRTRGGPLHALSDVSIDCMPRHSLGVVGESGCGKTTLNRLILMLDTPTEGEVRFKGKPLRMLSVAERRAYRRAVQPVFQNPYSSLNPRLRVRRIIREPLAANTDLSGPQIDARVDEVLEAVGLTARDANRLPAEFSGGQRQRIAIARALASKPELMLLDEPVSSQDISIRAQILNVLTELRDEYGLATLFVSHDLATVRFMCDEVVVIYLGRIVEHGPANLICTAPRHPYTQALLAATLPADPDAPAMAVPPEGEIPSPLAPPPGCAYHTRCPFAREICRSVRPRAEADEAGGAVACHMVNQGGW
ncbi:ABC transporter ATP-binding protein [Maritimibacter sp. HL-12]|uniref:ABC transporter ATP-binding protein n=1 Tax=Maritimibacter sp. HL-12 TaxID=1162418 RepID=UPI000A0F3772|nr:oligopeptide/dipeptide ABC transporter ATP-binding protein [Maritimibacter sp. HL-12]SMH38911.1 dipeptide transport system ATP-binding protein [Maritimibacter sp. HL-12]